MKSSKDEIKMTAYQKSGVILVSVILAILQKIKFQNYRLFLPSFGILNESDCNLTSSLNNTNTTYADENLTKFALLCLLINNSLAVISCIYLTSWSDKHGRKILLILPYVGSFITDIFMLITVLTPLPTRQAFLISEGIDGCFGGTVLMTLGCLCYITDSTDHRERSFLIALFLGLWNTTPVFDLAIQYYWTPFETGLDVRVLVLCAVLYRMVFAVCFLVYIKMCVSESVFILGTFQGNPWINLLTPINVSDTVNCVFKRRLDNMRFYIVLLTNIYIFYSICLFGNIMIFPRYFRNVFLWSEKDVLIYSVAFTVCQSFVLWCTTYLASQWRTLDSDLGTYGCVSLGISCLVLTITRQGFIAALGALVGVGSLLVPVSILSVLSKLVERTETGSMYAGIGFLTLVTQLIASSAYTALDEVCMEAGIPQVIFLLPFGCISFCLLFFIYLKKNISPHLLGHLNGSESLALIDRKVQIEQLFDNTYQKV